MKPITLPPTTVNEVEEALRAVGLLGPSSHLPQTLLGEVKLNPAQRTFLSERAKQLYEELRHKEFLRSQDIRKRAEDRRLRRDAKRLKDAKL